MKDTNHLVQRLETLLAEGLSAGCGDLDAKLRRVGNDLPDDLREMLQGLALGRTGTEEGENDRVEFAFLCGQAYERLESFVQSRLAANIAFHAPDGTLPLELEGKDFANLARFVALRDQMLKTVADYTLKFLLVSVILLVLGLSLGLI
ncbi:MAG: hypothetical protein NTX45_05850 [Proteobacteria bacterium]|nr:hypothetical protein [Pseudomonadota bacterium]